MVDTILTHQQLVDKVNILEEKLEYYRNLENKGHVYKLMPNEEFRTYRELLFEASGQSREDFLELTDYSFDDTTDGGQVRSPVKKNIYSMFIKCARKLGYEYKKDFNTTAPRFKVSVSSEDIINGKCGMKNEYPIGYIDVIHKFLCVNPLEDWGKAQTLEGFTHDETSGKYKCSTCLTSINKGSISNHMKSKTHIRLTKDKSSR
jgi:hypothetical protein